MLKYIDLFSTNISEKQIFKLFKHNTLFSLCGRCDACWRSHSPGGDPASQPNSEGQQLRGARQQLQWPSVFWERKMRHPALRGENSQKSRRSKSSLPGLIILLGLTKIIPLFPQQSVLPALFGWFKAHYVLIIHVILSKCPRSPLNVDATRDVCKTLFLKMGYFAVFNGMIAK